MPFLEVTDLYWDKFEEEFNIPRSNVVRVKNLFRHICQLYVMKNDLELWNEVQTNKENKTEITYYEFTYCSTHNHKWSKKIFKNETIDWTNPIFAQFAPKNNNQISMMIL